MIERTDDEHLQFATSQGRILYSFNLGMQETQTT